MMDNAKNTHNCSSFPLNGVEISKVERFPGISRKPWCLIVRREATEQDLQENTTLENEGDIIWETYVEISHCPYCGQQLSKSMKDSPKDFGKIRHYDHSGWDTVIG